MTGGDSASSQRPTDADARTHWHHRRHIQAPSRAHSLLGVVTGGRMGAPEGARAPATGSLRGDDPVAAAALCVVEGPVGLLDDVGDRLVRGRRRPRRRPRRVADATPNRDRSSDETASRMRSPTSTASSQARVPEQDRELLAAEPRRDVVLADGPGDRAGNARSTSSPTACPCVSFSSLNRSMSTMRMPIASSARRRRASSAQNSSK